MTKPNPTWAFTAYKNRAVHITTKPSRRLNLSQSRKILTALRKYGEVVTFRNLSYHGQYDTTRNTQHLHGKILAIFETEKAAKDAIESSPLSVETSEGGVVIRNDRPELWNPYSSTPPPGSQRRTESEPEPEEDPGSGANPNQNQNHPDDHDPNPDFDYPNAPKTTNHLHKTPPETLTLTCHINPSDHDHDAAQSRYPYHSTYFVSENSAQFRDQMKTGIPLRELADGMVGRKRGAPGRVKRGVARSNENWGAFSLMGLFRVGLEREEEKEREG